MGTKTNKLDHELSHLRLNLASFGDDELLSSLDIENIREIFIGHGWRLHLAENVVVINRKDLMTQAEWEHQAIKDGWVKIPQVEVVTRYEANKKPEVIMVNGKEVMTGQEWYDKLAKKLDEYAWSADEKDSILQAAFEVSHEAAKKAAGIE